MRHQQTLIRAIALTLALALPGLARAQEPFEYPDTEVARLVETFLESVNSGEPSQVKSFADEHLSDAFKAAVPVEQFLGIAAQLNQAYGTLTPRSVARNGDEVFVVLIESERDDMWANLSAEMAPDEPGKLAGVLFQPTAAPIAPDQDPRGGNWEDFEDLLTKTSAAASMPALAGAVYQDGRLTENFAVGVRRFDQESPVETGDLFHIGSVTKSYTATMIGALVEKGVLSWDTELGGGILGEIDMLDIYLEVSLAQLLRHRAGIQPKLHFEPTEMARLVALPGTPTEQREAFIAEVLLEEPVAPPGESSNYSNAGYAIAALMAERITGKPWDALVREYVFAPMDLESAGFGWPASPERPDQPWGHSGTTPISPDVYVLGEFLAPASDIHSSAADLARYASAHLAGLKGEDGVLKSTTILELHRAIEAEGEAEQRFACGWLITTNSLGEEVHWHNGSVGTFYTLVAIVPDVDLVVVLLTNTAGPAVEPALWGIVKELRVRMAEEK